MFKFHDSNSLFYLFNLCKKLNVINRQGLFFQYYFIKTFRYENNKNWN